MTNKYLLQDDVSGDGLSIGDNLSNLLEIINKNAVSQNPSDENPRRGIVSCCIFFVRTFIGQQENICRDSVLYVPFRSEVLIR